MKLHIFSAITGLWAALTVGAAAKASSIPVTMATDQPAQKIRKDGEFETVAAAQADQVLGAVGAIGDYLEKLVIVPATLSPGAVTIKDGGGAAITVFTGGANSVTELRPIVIPLGLQSLAGAWKVTTGANVSAIGIGKFAAA